MIQYINFIDRCHYIHLSLVLVSVVFIAYLPSLGHVFRSDQVVYMADMGQRPQTFQSLVIQGYDYPRDRLYDKGDKQLFRPLLFILMGLEYWVFGTDPLGWQLTGIVLHILCTLTIFRFLWLVFDRSLAFFCALYFGVLPTTMEMVVWQHINFYMLFIIFFYLACIGLLEYKKRYDIKSVLLVTASLTVAVVTYDMGCVVALIIAGYVFWITPQSFYRRFLNSGIILIPVVLFLAWDMWSLNTHHLSRGQLAIPGRAFNETIKNFFLIHLEYLKSIFLPSQYQIKIYVRFFYLSLNSFNPATIIWIVLFYYYSRAMSINVIRKGFELGSVFLISLSMLVLVLTIGRVNVRGFAHLNVNDSYYIYMYAAFCLPIIAGCIDIPKLKKLTVNNWQKYLLFFAIIGSIGFCFASTLNNNIEGSKFFAPQRELLTFVNQFINQHKNESNFSFTVAYDAKGNYFKSELIDPTDNINYTFAQIVYSRYYKNSNWRYRIFFDPIENIYRVQRKNWLT